MAKFSIDPITRIEGHMGVELKIEKGILATAPEEYFVTEAKAKVHSFRGFEIFLKGRDPRDALHITQRICGICPNPHGQASTQALDDAFGAIPPPAAILIRNIIEGFYYLYDHLIHFYLLIGPELGILSVYPPMVPPALGVEGMERLNLGTSYAKCVEIQRLCSEALALWGGKFPHIMSLYPGGVTVKPTLDKIASSIAKLAKIWEFVNVTMTKDLKAVIVANERIKEVTGEILGVKVGLEDIGVSTGNFLSYGIFPDHTDYEDWLDPKKRKKALIQSGAWKLGDTAPGQTPFDENKITEDVKYSFYKSPSGLHPKVGETEPYKGKPGAYSWVKAPRYDDRVYEVGPLARMVNTFGMKWDITKKVEVRHPITGEQPKWLDDPDLNAYELRNPMGSVLDRIVARAYMTLLVANKLIDWLLELNNYLDSPICNVKPVPKEATGRGLWEGPRGALGHWITIKDGKIARYQCVVPSTWNWSPRDDKDRPGAGEQALTASLEPLNGVWIPRLNVVQIANAINPDIEINWPARIKGWGNILGAALTKLYGDLALGLNMETAEEVGAVNSTIPLLIVRSFDPCLTCAVHLIMPNGKRISVHLEHDHYD